MLTPSAPPARLSIRRFAGPSIECAVFRTCVAVLVLCAQVLAADPPAASATPPVPADGALWTSAQPFAFRFLGWPDKPVIGDGRAVFARFGCKGGAGGPCAADLAALSERSPTLQVVVRPANTAKSLRFKLTDANGTAGCWIFRLPAPGGDPVRVTAQGAFSLAQPGILERRRMGAGEVPQPFDLGRIVGWQFIGDWEAEVLDVEVESVGAAMPDARMRSERQAAMKAQEEAAQRKAQRKADDAAARLPPPAP